MTPYARVSGPVAGEKAVEAQLEQIIVSEIFRRSPRMSRFLRFVVQRATQDLKEYTIAVEVFDRPSDFDPRVDPLVRVEARRLRQKLSEYYATTGQHDKIVIGVPKGSYVPDIRLRSSTTPSADLPRKFDQNSWSVVVLPFLNLGVDTEKDYFVDGLSEELTTLLAQVPDLRVIARTSAFMFRGKNADVRSIGRQLNVRALVEGSVRWSGSRLRITVQMADCQDGQHLCAESFDVEEKELFALQNEIAQMICDVIVPHLGDRATTELPRLMRQIDPEAYRLYLRGRYHWNRRTLPDFEKAIAYCEKAIAVQTNYAPAYACIADSCWMPCLDMLASGRERLPRAKAAATRALELDPSLAEAQCAFAITCVYDWHHDLAAAHYRRAIELNPSYATAHYLYACHHAIHGRDEQMFSELKLALEVDPLSVMVNRAMVAGLFQLRRFEDAVAQAKQTIELDPSFYGSYLYLAWAYMGMQRYDLAIQPLEQAHRLGGNAPVMLGYLAASKARLGQSNEAESILRQLLDPAHPFYVPPFVVAIALVALGQEEEALDFLERAVEERCGTIMHVRQDPFFAPLQGMRRFDQICRSMNLL